MRVLAAILLIAFLLTSLCRRRGFTLATVMDVFPFNRFRRRSNLAQINDPDVFTKRAQGIFQKTMPGAEIRIVGTRRLYIKNTFGNWSVNLDDTYKKCRTKPRRCDAEIECYANVILLLLARKREPLSPKNLMVGVCNKSFLDQMCKIGNSRANVVQQSIAGELALILFNTANENPEYLNQEDLAAVGLTDAQAIAAGKRNMEERSRSILADAMQTADAQLCVVPIHGHSNSALFAFPELWERVAQASGGGLYVSVPFVDLVLYTSDVGRDARRCIEMMTAEAFAGADTPISSSIFRWSPVGWLLETAESRPSRRQPAAARR